MNNKNNDSKRNNENYDRRIITDPPSAGEQKKSEPVSAIRKGFYIILLLGITAIGIYAIINSLVINQTAKNTPKAQSSAVSSTAPPRSAAVPANAPAVPQTSTSPKPAPTAPPDDSAAETAAVPIQPPVSGKILRDYSDTELQYSDTMKDWRTHNGVDIAANADTPVTAIKDGVLKKAYEDSLLGTTIIIHHEDNGTDSVYANLKEPTELPIGSAVKMGDVIGKVGASAVLEINDPPHLHFEIRQEDKALDPKEYVEFEEVDYVQPSSAAAASSAAPTENTSPAPTKGSTPSPSADPYGEDIETMIID